MTTSEVVTIVFMGLLLGMLSIQTYSSYQENMASTELSAAMMKGLKSCE